MRALRSLPGAAGLLLVSAATADAAEAAVTREIKWSWDWWVLAPLAVAALWYVAGIVRLHRRLGDLRVVGRAQIASFALGLGTIFVALESPIDSISDQLFCVHMVQHLLLMLVAAPLLVFGWPAIVFLWAFPARGRKRVGRLWATLGLHHGVRSIMHPAAVWLCTTRSLSAGISRGPIRRPCETRRSMPASM